MNCESDVVRRRLVVLDVDSTLINQEVIELIAAKAGSQEQVAEITDRAMRGELNFAESLRERVKTLEGLPVEVLNQVRNEVTLTPGAVDLVKAVKESGGFVGVVSGGFHEILDPLATSLDLDFWKANTLEVHNGLLTGNVLGKIIDATAKATALTTWAASLDIPLDDTVAIGDGANDLEMMKHAGTSIAFCAKPIVKESADFSINERDLSLALAIIER